MTPESTPPDDQPDRQHAPKDDSASLKTVGKGIEELNTAFSRLQHLGIDRSDIALPKVVVVGDQSAGKSSLIEAMSQIRVPRATGTCTRCPFQITTELNTEAWQCIVSLVQQYYIADEASLQQQEAAGHHLPLRPWCLNSQPSKIEFARVKDFKQLEDILRRAQTAVLHPSRNAKSFLSGRLTSKMEVEFSPNYISLEISGPGLPSLSFFDLPGVINQAESDGKEYLVSIVRTITKMYIQDPNALILLACSMEGDVHNSTAFSLVKKMGASERCIGVLTKPDRLPSGELNQIWGQILGGECFSLGHGWYVTKQPSQDEIGFNHEFARERESIFFRNHAPFAHPGFSLFKQRFGTLSLQKELSRLLVCSIRQSFPKIAESVDHQIHEYRARLAALPEPPANEAYHHILKDNQVFSSLLQRIVSGKGANNDFRQEWKHQKAVFREEMFNLRPRLVPTSQHDKHLQNIVALSKGSPLKRMLQEDVTESSDTEDVPVPVPTSPQKRKKPKNSVNASSSGLQSKSNEDHHNSYTLDTLKKALEDYSISGRQGVVDPEAVDDIISRDIIKWGRPTHDLLDGIGGILSARLEVATKQAFGKWENTAFCTLAHEVIHNFVHKCRQAHSGITQLYLRHEQVVRPSCENDDELGRAERSLLRDISELRFKARARIVLEAEAVRQGKNLELAELKEKLLKETKRLHDLLEHVPDPAQREIKVMADIRAYYNIASTRYVDNICRSFEAEVLLRIKDDLSNAIIESISTNADTQGAKISDYCEVLLAEDQGRATERQELKVKVENLLEAKTILDGVFNKYEAAGGEHGVAGQDNAMEDQEY